MTTLETDYVVVGAGAAGMAFADALVAHSDADVALVDRRHRPGGHWNDAYGFVRLHIPSAYYGVNSMPLGRDAVDRYGPNAGRYELASGAEVSDYFGRVLDEVLLPTGRVRFLGMHDYVEGDSGNAGSVVSKLTGETRAVTARRAVVDATYNEAQLPSTHTPSFDADPGVRIVPIHGLVRVTEPAPAYVVLGSGKTAIDAVLWLLDQGADADRIRWVRPRDQWLLDRDGWQPLDQVASIVEGLSLELEALAQATSVDDVFARLEQCGRLVRIDCDVTPTMYRCATVSREELAALRSVRDVVRLGHVRRLESDRMVLEHGEVPSEAGTLYVDCTARGVRSAPDRPVFDGERITLQQVRTCSPSFNAALIGYVEATRDDDDAKNRLCPPNRLPETAEDWIRCFATNMAAARAWSAEPDVNDWVEQSRLNLARGAMAHAGEQRMAAAFERFVRNIKPGVAAARRFVAETTDVPQQRQAAQERTAPGTPTSS